MKLKNFGFTVVEILLVISVLGILVTIGSVGWSGITKSSANNVRSDEVNQWITSFNLYKSRFGAWPALPVDDSTPKLLCLGRFSTNNNKCGQFASGAPSKYIDATSSDTTNMLTEITKVGKEPTDSAPAINKSLIGPFAYLTQSTTAGSTTVTGKFIGIFDGNTCPSGFTNDSTNVPSITLLAGVTSGTAIACASTKVITYNPNGDQVAVVPATPSVSPAASAPSAPSPSPSPQPVFGVPGLPGLPGVAAPTPPNMCYNNLFILVVCVAIAVVVVPVIIVAAVVVTVVAVAVAVVATVVSAFIGLFFWF